MLALGSCDWKLENVSKFHGNQMQSLKSDDEVWEFLSTKSQVFLKKLNFEFLKGWVIINVKICFDGQIKI